MTSCVWGDEVWGGWDEEQAIPLALSIKALLFVLLIPRWAVRHRWVVTNEIYCSK